MNNLPKEFLERMQQMLGDEYEAFLASYTEPRRPGLRVNLLKKGSEDTSELAAVLSHFGADPIPWAPTGYYYDPQTRPGKHPFHEAGVYYMQEPSAMAVAALSGVRPGMRVLRRQEYAARVHAGGRRGALFQRDPPRQGKDPLAEY